MAFVEKSGKNSWRVRYWTDDNTHGSIPGYTSKKAAQDKANEIDADQRRGTFLDPEPAGGIQHVFVNGQPVVRDGDYDPEPAPGRALRIRRGR